MQLVTISFSAQLAFLDKAGSSILGNGRKKETLVLEYCFFSPVSQIIQMNRAPSNGEILGMMLESWKSQAATEARMFSLIFKPD